MTLFLRNSCLWLCWAAALPVFAQAVPQVAEVRVRGMLTGTLLGDALGGPYEFKWPYGRSDISRDTQPLTDSTIQVLAKALQLVTYPAAAEPYGAWVDRAPAGTVTDDSRIKLIYGRALNRKARASAKRMARAMLDYPQTVSPSQDSLAVAWMEQFVPSALFTLGKRKDPRAKPVDALWAGVPTNLGQMAFLPAAALHPGAPKAAYQATWDADYFDQGMARDLHASTVAALSHALLDTATWAGVWASAIATDPYGLNQIPWAKRRTTYWIKFAKDAAARAEGVPSTLFHLLETEGQAIQWWDSWVPLVVLVSLGELTDYEPFAMLQLAIEFGYDTDSYCQLIGAFVGAMYGEDLWPEAWRKALYVQLELQYGVSEIKWYALWGH